MKRYLGSYFPYLIIGTWLLWLFGVLLAGSGLNIFGSRNFDFALPGQFGDAFGSLSGLMATLAAAGAWYAVALQRREIEEQNSARAADEVVRNQQAFEQNFFQLLGHLTAIVKETDIVSQRFRPSKQEMTTRTFTGKDAYRRIIDVLRQRLAREIDKEGVDISDVYMKFYSDYQDDLGHYFRILFHTCNYIYVHEEVDRDFYLKIVFAQLSNSELALVAYNCAFGHGQRRFKPIVEQFGCLTNLGFDSEYGFDERLLRQGLASTALPELSSEVEPEISPNARLET